MQSILSVAKLIVISLHRDDAVFAWGDGLLTCLGAMVATPGRPGASPSRSRPGAGDALEPERHGALVSDGEPP